MAGGSTPAPPYAALEFRYRRRTPARLCAIEPAFAQAELESCSGTSQLREVEALWKF
jgi:hypothetical protein